MYFSEILLVSVLYSRVCMTFSLQLDDAIFYHWTQIGSQNQKVVSSVKTVAGVSVIKCAVYCGQGNQMCERFSYDKNLKFCYLSPQLTTNSGSDSGSQVHFYKYGDTNNDMNTAAPLELTTVGQSPTGVTNVEETTHANSPGHSTRIEDTAYASSPEDTTEFEDTTYASSPEHTTEFEDTTYASSPEDITEFEDTTYASSPEDTTEFEDTTFASSPEHTTEFEDTTYASSPEDITYAQGPTTWFEETTHASSPEETTQFEETTTAETLGTNALNHIAVPCTGFPEYWFLPGGEDTCVRIFDTDRLEWTDTRTVCDGEGARLLRIENPLKRDRFRDVLYELGKVGGDYWVDATDAAVGTVFYWGDGTLPQDAVDPSLFMDGQPDNGGGQPWTEDCLVLRQDLFLMDEQCNTLHFFVCERVLQF